MDLVIIRENTEGEYSHIEHEVCDPGSSIKISNLPFPSANVLFLLLLSCTSHRLKHFPTHTLNTIPLVSYWLSHSTPPLPNFTRQFKYNPPLPINALPACPCAKANLLIFCPSECDRSHRKFQDHDRGEMHPNRKICIWLCRETRPQKSDCSPQGQYHVRTVF